MHLKRLLSMLLYFNYIINRCSSPTTSSASRWDQPTPRQQFHNFTHHPTAFCRKNSNPSRRTLCADEASCDRKWTKISIGHTTFNLKCFLATPSRTWATKPAPEWASCTEPQGLRASPQSLPAWKHDSSGCLFLGFAGVPPYMCDSHDKNTTGNHTMNHKQKQCCIFPHPCTHYSFAKTWWQESFPLFSK